MTTLKKDPKKRPMKKKRNAISAPFMMMKKKPARGSGRALNTWTQTSS
jgi:hypothetical protein